MAQTKKTTSTKSTAKTTTAKKTTTVAKTAPVVEEVVAETPVVEQVVEKKVEKVYNGNELIPCRSVTEGTLLCRAGKDKDLYTWAGYGDVTEVTYDDLMSLRAKKSPFLFSPLFIIDDDELLEQPRWKNLKDFYETMYDTEDIDAIINLPLAQFQKVIGELPKGLQGSVITNISSQLEAGTFDSIQKVKFVDQTLGTDLSVLL